MTKTDKNFDAWLERFGPSKMNAEYSELFETYGDDLKRVKKTNIKCVWTLVEVDDKRFLIPGFHLVNRLNYLIASHPRNETDDAEWDEVPFDEENMDE
ncbi:hypothetical protein [Bartonella choladocola]|uniref:Uncharacterized protein n=1 Tax=Bartonella choladocola TaxID=2750995 RepID=A0A1U9MJT6_9HYPH|nr:hypothetical protein [Bartonella choladocola]AQT47983.1 hypothetical protein BBC0122_018880 [Bartonella choladocola]